MIIFYHLTFYFFILYIFLNDKKFLLKYVKYLLY